MAKAKAKAKPKTKAKAKAKSKASKPSPVDAALALARDQHAQMVDFKFVDLPGTWQHFTMPIADLEPDVFEDGLGFDGSSIRGWQEIDESDMLVVPDPTTAVMDPFMAAPTLSLVCSVEDPITRQPYLRDPRGVAQRAQAYLAAHPTGRHRLLWTGSRVFHLRQHPLRPAGASRVLRDRLAGRPLELRLGRRPQLRLQARLQGRLLPRAADRFAARHPHRDGADHAQLRPRRGDSPPRGGHGRPRRNRHSLLSAA